MDMLYNQQPTLLVGLGGFGSKITDNIYERINNNSDVVAFSVDTDMYISHTLKNIPKEHFISLSQGCPLEQYLNAMPEAKEWFPKNPILHNKTLSEGAGQVRAVSRLAYNIALKEHKFEVLLNEAYKIAQKCVNNNSRMRISIITSLVGGTGSGIFIQIALLLRKHVNKFFPTLNVKIHGEFILPSNFLFRFSNPTSERRHMESNAYASLKELNAINEHFFSNAKPVNLKYDVFNNTQDETGFVDSIPYDYCFLYDRVNYDRFQSKYIEDAIIERLFSISSNSLNEEFIKSLRVDDKKRAGNLYGIMSVEKLPLDSSLFDSDIFRSIINRVSENSGKRILMVTAPRKSDVDLAQLPQNTIFIENIIDTVTEMTISELNFGVELVNLEKIKYSSGQYFISYKDLINELPNVITPHLDRKWHIELPDIGVDLNLTGKKVIEQIPQQKIPNNAFIFISYSSQEIETANQINHILETNGIHCWMAPQSIPAGSDYGSEIPKAIDKCSAFLLLLSKASQESNWVPKEVGLAIGKGKIVVPFQIDNETIGDAFNFYLTNSQRISAYNRMAEAYQELIGRLKDILN